MLNSYWGGVSTSISIFYMENFCELTVKCSSEYLVLFQSVLNFHQLALEDFCRRSKAEAFARRRVEAVANRLQVSICQRRRFGRAGQVLSQPVVRVFHGALLIRCLRITEPRISTALLQKSDDERFTFHLMDRSHRLPAGPLQRI